MGRSIPPGKGTHAVAEPLAVRSWACAAAGESTSRPAMLTRAAPDGTFTATPWRGPGEDAPSSSQYRIEPKRAVTLSATSCGSASPPLGFHKRSLSVSSPSTLWLRSSPLAKKPHSSRSRATRPAPVEEPLDALLDVRRAIGAVPGPASLLKDEPHRSLRGGATRSGQSGDVQLVLIEELTRPVAQPSWPAWNWRRDTTGSPSAFAVEEVDDGALSADSTCCSPMARRIPLST